MDLLDDSSTASSNDSGKADPDDEGEVRNHSLGVVNENADEVRLERTVPHRPGFWAGHIFVRCTGLEDEGEAWIQRLAISLRRSSNPLIRHSNHHVSLSKPFYVSFVNIDSIVKGLTRNVEFLPRRSLTVHTRHLIRLENDEGTRTFWGWEVTGCNDLVQAVDGVLKAYSLATYYDPPTFHTSIASMVGSTNISCPAVGYECEERHACYIPVTEIEVTFGTTKAFTIPLRG